jgi:subtilisin family serine protease
MKKKIVSILILTLLIGVVVIPVGSSNKVESIYISKTFEEKSSEMFQQYNPNEFFVKFNEGTPLVISSSDNIITTGIKSIDYLNEKFNVLDIEETYLSVIKKPKNPELFSSLGLDRIYTFKVVENTNVLDAIDAFEKNPFVVYAEVNGIGHAASPVFPNDAHFGKQWGLHNTGTSPPEHPGKVDADIDAPEAWDVEKGDSNIVIAIIDKGIDWTHSDLSANIWTNPGEDVWSNPNDPYSGNGVDDDGNGFIDDWKGWNFISDDGNSQDQSSDSHGTHCAGIAGAVTDNNIGVAGVSWYSKLMAVRAMYKSGTIYWSDAGPAIVYAADNGADIISMSFGGYGSNSTLKGGVDYAYGSGCVLVAAMGNQAGQVTHIPASYSNTIAVGATDTDDTRAVPGDWGDPNAGSNYGNHIDVIAPGSWIYSTLNNNMYGYKNGTSMATPMVAGLSALLLAKDPSRTNVEIRELIREYADDQVGNPMEDTAGFDKYYGYGRINAHRAIKSKSISFSTIQISQHNYYLKSLYPVLFNLMEKQPNMFIIVRTILGL